MCKHSPAAVACLGAWVAIVLGLGACKGRAEKGTTAQPQLLPVAQVTIAGQCYIKYEGRKGVWYCFPCNAKGSGRALPCDSLVHPPIAYSPRDTGSFREFMGRWLALDGIDPTNSAVLAGFKLDTSPEGVIAPISARLSEIDTFADYIQVLFVSRSDWGWPDSSKVTVECLAFPDGKGQLPGPWDDAPDALAFRVSGKIMDVANAVSGMFGDQFTWLATIDADEFRVKTARKDDDTLMVNVYMNGQLLWSNE